MNKEINIDEILEKYYQVEYDKTKRGQVYPTHHCEVEYIKQAIKEILTETLQMCSDEVELETRHYSRISGKYTSENIGQEVNVDDMNNYIGIDKESITSLINKIKF